MRQADPANEHTNDRRRGSLCTPSYVTLHRLCKQQRQQAAHTVRIVVGMLTLNRRCHHGKAIVTDATCRNRVRPRGGRAAACGTWLVVVMLKAFDHDPGDCAGARALAPGHFHDRFLSGKNPAHSDRLRFKVLARAQEVTGNARSRNSPPRILATMSKSILIFAQFFVGSAKYLPSC